VGRVTNMLHKHLLCHECQLGNETNFNDISCDDTPRTQPRRYLSTCARVSELLPGFEPGKPGRRLDFWYPPIATNQSLPRRFLEEPTPMEDTPIIQWRDPHYHPAHYIACITEYVCYNCLILVLFYKKWLSTVMFAS
jgi:hypothetical protein